MHDIYRVICCENKEKYPGRLFIDIYPAEFVTHELLYRMRLKVTPEVHDITGGVYLTDLGNGEVCLKYIKHFNKFLHRQQEEMRRRVDPKIKELFFEMKKRGISQTLRATLNDAYEVFGADMMYVKSAKEEEMKMSFERLKRRERIMAERNIYYANRKYASKPHLALMLMQLERTGD